MSKAILIQARLSSSRFPSKMLHDLGNYKLIEYVYNRCLTSKASNSVLVITSSECSDDELYSFCINKNINVFRGDLDDVLKRYLKASEENKFDIICRVCGDSPFVDIAAIDNMFYYFEKNKTIDYMSTSDSLNGFMSEAFTLNLLRKIYNVALTKNDKEHVTKYVRDHMLNFQTKELKLNLRPEHLSSFTLTIDYLEDIILAEKIVDKLKDFTFTSLEVIEILKKIKKDKNELQNT